MNNDFESELKHVPDTDNQPPIPDDVPSSRIIRPELLEEDPAIRTRAIPVEPKPATPIPVVTPMTDEEAEELGHMEDAWEAVSPTVNAIEEVEKRISQGRAEQEADTLAMFDAAIAHEDTRTAELDKKLEDEDSRKMLLGEDAAKAYVSPKSELGGDYVERTQVASNVPSPDELMPSYDYDGDDDDDPPEATSATPEDRMPTPGNTAEYAKYIKDLTVVELEYDDGIATIIKDKGGKVSTVPANRKIRVVGDQAFDNSVNKFKKDNFRIVQVPLVNSGIMASIVGTGGLDLVLMYDQTDEHTPDLEYEMQKMRIIMRSVVGTDPKIDKNELRNLIHYADYDMMAYGHLVATLSTVEMVQTCTECGRDFRIQANSGDLLLNRTEITERMTQIKAAGRPEQLSLMTRDRKIDTPDNFCITVGHPSYAEYVQFASELKAIAEQQNGDLMRRISALANILNFIRMIKLPNGTITNNLYQRYRALTMLSEDSYNLVEDQITTMAKQIIYPKFGIRKVKCPHCGKNNTNIQYKGVSDLLFFHIMVNRLLKLDDQ